VRFFASVKKKRRDLKREVTFGKRGRYPLRKVLLKITGEKGNFFVNREARS